MMTEKKLKEFYYEGERLAQYLPWMYCSEDGVVVLDDGSIGKIYKIEPAAVELKDAEEIETIERTFETLLVRLPEEIDYQFILLASSDINEELENYLNYKERNPVGMSEECIKNKIEFLKEGKDGIFKEGNRLYTLRKFRVFFTIRIHLKKDGGSLAEQYQ